MILMHDRTYQKRLDEIKMLQELNHTFSDKIDELCIQKKDFQHQIDYLLACCRIKQQRIDKSIKYINEKLIPYGEEWHWDNATIGDMVNKLLDILKGNDNDDRDSNNNDN